MLAGQDGYAARAMTPAPVVAPVSAGWPRFREIGKPSEPLGLGGHEVGVVAQKLQRFSRPRPCCGAISARDGNLRQLLEYISVRYLRRLQLVSERALHCLGLVEPAQRPQPARNGPAANSRTRCVLSILFGRGKRLPPVVQC